MFKSSYSDTELREILAKTVARRGWDFSIMKTERQPVPWEYLDVVALYLTPTDEVLDIGTGGGERFLKLFKKFKSGIGIDIDLEMIKTAKENGENRKNVIFRTDSCKLESTSEKFDVILSRHAPFDLNVVYSHLKPNGYFITQEVGEKNMLNIKEVLGQKHDRPTLTKSQFDKSKYSLVSFMEYNVEYIVKDVESLVFWLNALDCLHSDLKGNEALKDADLFNKILEGNVTKKGFVTNEHRYLVVAQKL